MSASPIPAVSFRLDRLPVETDGAALDAERAPFEDVLRQWLCRDQPPNPVSEAMRYSVFGAAGRMRPVLAMRVGRLAGAPVRLTARAAAAVEILHCASLIVDDLPCMDNAAERRGRPSVHVAFGEATAVLAAHCMVSLAARNLVAGDYAPHELPEMLRFQVKLLKALDSNGLIAGQSLDLEVTQAGQKPAAHRIHDMKTVPLFRLAVEAGGIAGPRWAGHEFALRTFAREFGLLFQIADDFADGDIASFQPVEEQAEIARQSLASVCAVLPEESQPLLELIDRLYVSAARR